MTRQRHRPDESAAEVTVVPLDHRTFCNEPTPGSTSEVLMLIHVAATATDDHGTDHGDRAAQGVRLGADKGN